MFFDILKSFWEINFKFIILYGIYINFSTIYFYKTIYFIVFLRKRTRQVSNLGGPLEW